MFKRRGTREVLTLRNSAFTLRDSALKKKSSFVICLKSMTNDNPYEDFIVGFRN